MANELFFDKTNNAVKIKLEQSIEDFEQQENNPIYLKQEGISFNVMLESIIERHYRAYLDAYKADKMELAKVHQDTLKDLYTIKNGVYPNTDEEYLRWLAFWGELAENYGS